jgi:hypothetical protein
MRIAVRNWQEFRAAINGLRRRFPCITRNRVHRKRDQQEFNNTFPVIYELVFRGQTRDYVDPQSGKSLLLPQAFRPGVKASWLHRVPPALWPGFGRRQQDPRSLLPDCLSESNLRQYNAYHRALVNYCVSRLDVPDAADFKTVFAKGWVPAGSLEDDLNRVRQNSTVRQNHHCILTDHPYSMTPPLRQLLDDLARYHDCQSVLTATIPRLSHLRGLKELRPTINFDVSNDAVVYHLKVLYAYQFLSENVFFMPVALAILQHYGLPTKGLDVTFDPCVTLWFAGHFAGRGKRRLRFEDSRDPGYLYVLRVPVTFDWGRDGGKYYRWARARGYGIEKLRSPAEPGLLIDLSASLTAIDRDTCTRSVRQQAALLMAHVLRPDWPSNAYAEYLVATVEVSPELWEDPEYRSTQYRIGHLFPPPCEDRLLFEMRRAGVRGLEVPSVDVPLPPVTN